MKFPNLLFEFWVLLRTAGVGVAMISVTLLVQDKICANEYHQSHAYCLNISKATNSIMDKNIKDDILADSAKFNNYKNLIECIPMVLWSLFVGSFLDNYPGGTRLMMLLSIFGDFVSIALYTMNIYYFNLNSNFILLSAAIYWFTGGMAAFFTMAFRYIVITSNEKIRPLKFMLFQFATVAGLASGTYIGGQLLVVKTDPKSPQMRTYYNNFALYFGLDVIALIVTFWLKSGNNDAVENSITKDNNNNSINCDTDGESSVYGEEDNILDKHKGRNYNYDTISAKQSITNGSNKRSQAVDTEAIATSKAQINHKKNVLVVLFNLDNVKQTLQCFTRPRAQHVRLQIYLLFVILFGVALVFFGGQTVMFQFTEKVYQWDSKTYTTFSSISNIVSTLFMTLCTVLLVKKWKFEDSSLLIIALISYFLNQLTLGTFLYPAAYFVALLIGSLNGFATLAIRNKVSKIVPQEEIGKIFSLASTIEATLPFFGSLIYTYIFAASIGSYPGLIFQFGAGVVVLSLALMVFVELYCRD